MGRVHGVVDGDDEGQQPGDDTEDLVRGDGARAVSLLLTEGVVWKRQSVCGEDKRGRDEEGGLTLVPLDHDGG